MEHQTMRVAFGDRDAVGNFDIRITSPKGEEQVGQFVPPFDQSQFQDCLTLKDKPLREKVKTLGLKLFEAVFSGAVGSAFELAISQLGEEEILRIDLCFNPRDADHQALSSLPWEIMYWERKGKYLALDNKVLLNRHLAVREALGTTKTLRRLKVLAVIANPICENVRSYDTEPFRKCLRDKLGDACDLHFLEQQTILCLTAQLKREKYDILHFTGHGWQQDGEWVIGFELVNGGLDPVTAQDLRHMLDAYPDLKFINLVSCNLAHSGTPQCKNELSGVAHSLVNQGIPAVAAMQFPIQVDHALIFMDAFYSRLAENLSLEDAFDWSRKCLYLEDRNGVAFASPVLFFRGQESSLWRREPPDKILLNSRYKNLDKQLTEYKEVLDFADCFESKDDSITERTIRRDEDWKVIATRINRLREKDWDGRRLEFSGEVFLPIAFAAGFAFRAPGKFEVMVQQYNQKTKRDELWQPDRSRARKPLEVTWEGQFLGGELMIAINANAPTLHRDVKDYRSGQKHLRHLPVLQLSVPDASREAITDEAEGIGYVNAIVDTIRGLPTPECTHLFLAMPKAMAFLIAYELNASGKFKVYAHDASGYAPAFDLF